MPNYKGAVGEQAVLNFIQKNYDNQAKLYGGMDSTEPDIKSEKLGIIEVKSIPAQCGQFTESTKNQYKYSDEIILAFGKNIVNNMTLNDNELCKKWVQNYYVNYKKVNYFGVYC